MQTKTLIHFAQVSILRFQHVWIALVCFPGKICFLSAIGVGTLSLHLTVLL